MSVIGVGPITVVGGGGLAVALGKMRVLFVGIWQSRGGVALELCGRVEFGLLDCGDVGGYEGESGRGRWRGDR